MRDITEMRAGLVHSGAIVEKAKGREEELIQKLERIVRACLYHALSGLYDSAARQFHLHTVADFVFGHGCSCSILLRTVRAGASC